MDSRIACENYNRICGLINILNDMIVKTSVSINKNPAEGNKDASTTLQFIDNLYLASIVDVIKHLETLRSRTPWTPVSHKHGEVYL